MTTKFASMIYKMTHLICFCLRLCVRPEHYCAPANIRANSLTLEIKLN